MKTRGQQLNDFAKELHGQTTFIEGMHYVSAYLKKHIPADRASIFIYDTKNNRLWSTHADQIERITIPSDMGLIGQCLQSKATVLENEPYGNTNFMADVDMQTGYYTQNTLSTPIFDTQKEIIAVLQLLNKKGGFTKEDKNYIGYFAQKLAPYIEANSP